MSKIPWGKIDEIPAKLMKMLYTESKYKALDQSERTSFKFTPSLFVELLAKVINYSDHAKPYDGHYDGVRIYFGTLYNNGSADYRKLNGDKNIGKLLLILVPTTKGEMSHDDDLNYIYATTGEVYIKTCKENASDWIRKYYVTTASKLTIDGNRLLYGDVSATYFEETKCLWYELRMMTSNDNKYWCGLIEYIKQLQGAGTKINSIKVLLGGIIQVREVDLLQNLYHLSLVFYIEEPTNKGYFTFSKNQTNAYPKGFNKDDYEKFLLNVNADTGNPCPPPNPASQCAGSKLPI